jgi:protein SCO1
MRSFVQPFNITAGVLFIGTALGLYAYFTYEKERMERKRIAEQTKGIGRPKVGGQFDLVDQDGNRFTNEDMNGKYALVRLSLEVSEGHTARKKEV